MKQFRDTDYYVTEDGNVYRKWKLGLKIRKPYKNKYGYIQIGLTKDGIQKQYLLHRIIAECYLPNPHNLPEVNHDDGNKNNNHVSNLYWCTSSHNVKHAFDTGLKKRGEKHYKSLLTEEQVQWIRKSYIPRHKEFSARAFSRKFNVSKSCILHILHMNSWTHLNLESDSTNQ